MLKIYMDNCCYNRPFDDLNQEKIYMEANAIQIILKRHTQKIIEIFKSVAIDFEIAQINYDSKRRQVEDLYDAMDLQEIPYSKEIEKRALQLKKYNIKDMDALHIAFAENANIDYFITTDRLLINAAKRAKLEMKVINPIEFVMEVI
jgi:predicted nucleic acid-binding protein